MRISYRSLPEETIERIRRVIYLGDTETYVITQARQTLAQTVVAIGVLSIALIAYVTDSLRWGTAERVLYRSVLFLAVPAMIFGLAYLARWAGCEFKPCVVVSPRYVLRTYPRSIEVLETRVLSRAQSWRLGSKYLLRVISPQGSVLFLAPQRLTNQILKDLEQFPHYIHNLEKRGDTRSLNELELFSEAQLNKAARPIAILSFAKGALAAALLFTAVYGGTRGFSLLDAHNEFRADQLQWDAAKAHPIAPEFRKYLDTLPRGRHSSEAASALNQLYVSAAERYRQNATLQENGGRAAVLALLEHARTTGRFRVAVSFQRVIKFPDHLVEDLKQEHSVKKIEPPHAYFSDERNKYREAAVFQTIQSSFDSALGDGLLVFETQRSEADEPELLVAYDVGPSGGLYYPTAQEKIPDPDRDWIAGVQFVWNVKLSIDRDQKDDLSFQVESEPAQEFSSDDNGLPITPEQRYNGMARSAFEDLGRQLFAKLSIPKVDPKQSPEQK